MYQNVFLKFFTHPESRAEAEDTDSDALVQIADVEGQGWSFNDFAGLGGGMDDSNVAVGGDREESDMAAIEAGDGAFEAYDVAVPNGECRGDGGGNLSHRDI